MQNNRCVCNLGECRFENAEESIKQYTELLASLKSDLEIVVRFTHPSVVQARLYGAGRGSQSVWANPPPDDAAFLERCKAFAEKYDWLLSQW
jgi:hypothetical protein